MGQRIKLLGNQLAEYRPDTHRWVYVGVAALMIVDLRPTTLVEWFVTITFMTLPLLQVAHPTLIGWLTILIPYSIYAVGSSIAAAIDALAVLRGEVLPPLPRIHFSTAAFYVGIMLILVLFGKPGKRMKLQTEHQSYQPRSNDRHTP